MKKSEPNQGELFDQYNEKRIKTKLQDDLLSRKPLKESPLPHRARPKVLEEFLGKEHLFLEYPFLKEKEIPALIIWGPPGSGKTTLAQILADHTSKELYTFNAVLGGVNDLKKLILGVREIKERYNKDSLIFVDEIHRFNKAQQDALLPFVEAGEFTLIGATTLNPRIAINHALLSRTQVIELKKHQPKDLSHIMKKTAKRFSIKVDDNIIDYIANFSDGDARVSLNILDIIGKQKTNITIESVKTLVKKNGRHYDKNHDRHFDTISAFIKSMRGSDPSAALLYLAIMLDGGEDPVYIARRLVIFASEDIGNADPQALPLAIAGLQAVQLIGMPEGRINLGHVTTYLASTVKSNACYLGINEAMKFVKEHPTIEIPPHLKSEARSNKKYHYPHDFPHHFVDQKYTEKEIPTFYRPSEMGIEKKIKERLIKIWG